MRLLSVGCIDDVAGVAEESVSRPLSVGVVVDLELGSHAGGHVKCWERFAEAAVNFPDEIDLTIYYLGEKETEISLASHVRYHLLPPLLGTNRIPFLRERSRDTDLAPFNPWLARLLCRHEVLHLTSAFTSSRTARLVAKHCQIPLVSSIHTDLPEFTRVYSQAIISSLIKQDWLTTVLFDRLQIQNWLADKMRHRLQGLLRDSDRVLISKQQDYPLVQTVQPASAISHLRRGIDQERFHPKHRDRQRLHTVYGISPDVPILLFVGRVDNSKKVMTLVEAAEILLQAETDLHVLIVGEGALQDEIRQRLGANVTLPGSLPQSELGWLYASADLFVFPSESEVSPNVVLEAKASGLPVFVSGRDGAAQFVQKSGWDGILVESSDPQAWSAALSPYLKDFSLREQMGRTAYVSLTTGWPSWIEVFQQDLLPIWQAVRADRATNPALAENRKL